MVSNIFTLNEISEVLEEVNLIPQLINIAIVDKA